MATVTFDQINDILAEHRRAEEARNAPAAVALDALNVVRESLAAMTAPERADIINELCTLIDDASDAEWAGIGAALATREG